MAEQPEESKELLAALDLGSNSFHLVVARLSNGQLVVVDRLREMVRLGSGVDETGRLSEPVARGALECLSRFGQRLAGIPRENVRAVGTNALRRARNRSEFLRSDVRSEEGEHLFRFCCEAICGTRFSRWVGRLRRGG